MRTFQLMGRCARRLIWIMRSISSSVNPLRQPSVTHSSVVPSCPLTTSASSSTSSRDAHREGTGSPSPSEWVKLCVVENPNPPASIAALSSRFICPSCSGVASLPTESAPITSRRSAQ